MICANITTINGRRVMNTRIFLCKCQYLSVIFENFLIGINMVEKHKIVRIRTHFIGVTYVKIQSRSLLLHDYKKKRKMNKEQI